TAQTRSALFEQLLHPAAKRQLLSAEDFARAPAPVVERRLTDLHDPAQYTNRVVGRFGLDKAKLYFISFAKKADAFFKISFSINKVRFSLRNLMSSSRSDSARVFPSSLASCFSFQRYN